MADPKIMTPISMDNDERNDRSPMTMQRAPWVPKRGPIGSNTVNAAAPVADDVSTASDSPAVAPHVPQEPAEPAPATDTPEPASEPVPAAAGPFVHTLDFDPAAPTLEVTDAPVFLQSNQDIQTTSVTLQGDGTMTNSAGEPVEGIVLRGPAPE